MLYVINSSLGLQLIDNQSSNQASKQASKQAEGRHAAKYTACIPEHAGLACHEKAEWT